MKKVKMNVDGIMCINCVKKVNTALSESVGCETSSVSDDFKEVFVEFNENQTSTEKIAAIIESLKDKSFQVIKSEEIQ